MNTKKIILAGTLAVTITLGGSMWSKKTEASPVLESRQTVPAAKEDLVHVLGAASHEEIYDALYNGNSLADIALKNNGDIQHVIDLQVRELTEQLKARLASGSITREDYEKQKDEIHEIITKSVYEPYSIS